MRNLKWVLLAGSLLLNGAVLGAQELERKVDISGQIRARNEMDNKDFNSDTDPYSFSLLRTRMGVKATFGNKLEAFVQIQDSRTYGDNSGTPNSIKNVDLHQAYFQVNELFWKWLTVKGGRMEFAYDNQRLLGALGWLNAGRAFEGGMATLTFDKVAIDLLSAQLYESFRAADEVDGDKNFAGIYAKTKFLKNKTLNFYLLADQFSKQNADEDNELSRGTFGSYFKGNFNALDIEAEVALQGGSMAFGATDIKANMLTAMVGYTFKGAKKPRIAVGIDRLSGDDPDTEDYECFNTLYATNHKFYGYMDYFTNIPAHTKNLGLVDLMIKGGFKPHEKMLLTGDLHLFSLAQDATLSDESTSKKLGTEFDLTFDYNYLKNVSFTLGASIFSPGEVMKEWKKVGDKLGEDASSWVYSQTTVNF